MKTRTRGFIQLTKSIDRSWTCVCVHMEQSTDDWSIDQSTDHIYTYMHIREWGLNLSNLTSKERVHTTNRSIDQSINHTWTWSTSRSNQSYLHMHAHQRMGIESVEAYLEG
jgi:hypothetical protein